jgi:isoleucyl-tRNA synthetase
VRRVRRVITGALELERKEKRIGSSLQAAPAVHLGPDDLRAVAGLDLAELAITSGIALRQDPAPPGAFTLEDVPGVAVVPALAEGLKCQRCWQVLPEVAESPDELCRRCTDAVAALAAG